MKPKKNVSISDVMLGRAAEIMKLRGFDDFSELVAALIREEYERRGLNVASAPPPPSIDRAALIESWTAPTQSLNDKLAEDIKAVAVKPVTSYKKNKK